MFQTRWLMGALAAALWIGPAAAQSASDQASDTAHSAKDTASDTAHGAKDTASDTASSAKSSAEHAASTTGKKARAMGQQASSDTARTLAKLHEANQAEVKAGEWMKEHATNDKVKDFAGKMVDDHSKMDQDVMSFAKDQGIDLTSAPKVSEADKRTHERDLSRLKEMSGAQADRHYMTMMVQDHQKDVKEVRSAEAKAKKDKNDKLASLLGDSAKTMEGHLKDARDVQKSLQQRQARTGSSSSTGTSDQGTSSATGSGSTNGSSSSSTSGSSGLSGTGSQSDRSSGNSSSGAGPTPGSSNAGASGTVGSSPNSSSSGPSDTGSKK